jgi:hypothetical protein
MLVYPLNTFLGLPLEREFEAWTVRCIEDYLADEGWPGFVCAVSPNDERTWPSDEYFAVDGKLVGLQFKRPKVDSVASGSGPTYDRLRWYLGNPPGQYQSVQAHSEIYYCLPTFVHRALSRDALHHCLFWRPPVGAATYSIWYDGTSTVTSISRQPEAMRWGQFIESIMRCTVGRRVFADESLSDVLAEWKYGPAVDGEFDNDLRPARAESNDDDVDDTPLYIVYLPLGQLRGIP